MTYKKYLADIKYFSFYSLSFIFGFLNIISIIILLIFKSFNKYDICFNKNCISIFDFVEIYFQKKINLILSFIFSIIFISLFFFFYYSTFYHFTTNHVLLAFYIYIIISVIMEGIKNIKSSFNWIMISLLILFSMFGLFIYLEIIELNIFNLNKNTRRAISERANQQVKEDLTILEDINDDEGQDENKEMVEISPGYLINN